MRGGSLMRPTRRACATRAPLALGAVVRARFAERRLCAIGELEREIVGKYGFVGVVTDYTRVVSHGEMLVSVDPSRRASVLELADAVLAADAITHTQAAKLSRPTRRRDKRSSENATASIEEKVDVHSRAHSAFTACMFELARSHNGLICAHGQIISISP